MSHRDDRERHEVRRHLLVLGLYLLLAVLMTFPLIMHMTTHVPGDGRDDPPLVWNLWWVRHALIDLHTNPLLSSYMFFPIGINLTYFTLTLLNGVLSIPLQVGGLVLASNIELLGSYAIGAFGAYLLALHLLAGARSGHPGASRTVLYLPAFLAGLVYAFAPIKMIFASLGQFNMTSTQWLPLCVLYVLRATRPLRQPPAPAAPGRSLRERLRIAAKDMQPRVDALGHSQRGNLRPDLGVTAFIKSLFPRTDHAGRRDAAMAALFLLLTAYAEFTFASFLLIFVAVYLLYLLIRRRRTLLSGIMAGRLALLGLIFLAGIWPIIGSMLHEMAVEGDYSLTAGWGFADIFSADLLGFITPSVLHPLLGAWARQASGSFSYMNFASAGFVVLVLAIVGVLAARRRHQGTVGVGTAPPAAFWGWSALLYAILSLGPVLHVAGHWVFNLDGLLVRIPLPFIILHYIPFIKANRYPSRLQVLVVLCLSVLVAYGAQALMNRTRMNAEKARMDADGTQSLRGRFRDRLRSLRVDPRSIALLLSAAILFEFLAVPLPLSDMRVPEVYKRIAQDNGGAPVLDLPISWRNSFQFIPQKLTEAPLNVNTVVMFEQFYQTTHGGPILSGNTSRNPEFKFTYFLEAPVISTIVALEEGRAVDAEQIRYDHSIIPEVLRFFGVKYIVLHPPYVGGPLEDYVRAVFPVEPIPADAGLSAYRVIAPPPVARTSIDLGASASNLYRAEGWGEPQDIYGRLGRWTDRDSARLLIPMSGSGPATISVDWYNWWISEGAGISLNGHWLKSTEMGKRTWETLTLSVPAGVAHAGLNELVFSSPTVPPGNLSYEAAHWIGKTGVHTNGNIVVHSAGLDAGGDMGFAHIYVNGKDAVTGRRGINVAVIDPKSGKVQQTAGFDLLADAGNAARFLDFITAVPDGRIVAVAVMDDASINFDDNCVAALRLIGAQADLRNRLRNSYAATGVKGAQPGQALEQWQYGRPASVAVGAHIYGKGLGLAVSSVIVEQP